MKIADLNKQVDVPFQGPKQEDEKICTNCNRLKIAHNNDQMYNCVIAKYLKA